MANMVSHQRVQDYLKRHKISNLFEELMAKIISDLPDEPVPYLIRTLQRKTDRYAVSTKTSASLRRSTGDLRPGSPEAGRKGNASVWASSSDSMAVAKGSKYDKPWLTNSKRVKPHRSTDGEVKREQDWDSSLKVKDATFDDMWASSHKHEKDRTASRQRSASPSRRQQLTWADADNTDEDLLYYSHGYQGPRKPRETDDPLAGELPLSKAAPVKETPATSQVSLKKKDKESGQHRKALEQLVLKERQAAQQDSGYEEEQGLDEDIADELTENIEDLKNEGVTNFKKTGVRAVKTTRSRIEYTVTPQVKVSICARCARVMTGEPSEPAVGTRYGELPSFDYDTERQFEERPQSAARSFALESDEEFESVSQVTGPRRPVWQEEQQADALTPRKGTHMFSSHAVPSKGRPMYSPEASVVSKTSGQGEREADLRRSHPSSEGGGVLERGGNPMMHTWSPGYSREDYSEVKGGALQKGVSFEKADSASPLKDEQREVVTPSVLKKGSMGWQQGYETDASSVDWNRDEGSPTRQGRRKPVAY